MSKRGYTACDGHTPHRAIDRIAAMEPSCDRDALLALADEIDEYADGGGARFGRLIDSSRAKGYAQRIREAVGVRDG